MHPLNTLWEEEVKSRKPKKRKWSEEDHDFFMENYLTMDIDKLSEEMNRSKQALYARAPFYGLSRPKKKEKPPTRNQIINSYIKEHYLETPASEIGALFGITGPSVSNRARRMGIRKNRVLTEKDKIKPRKRKWWEAPKKRNK